MEQRLDRMLIHQELLNQGLIQEMKAVVQTRPQPPPPNTATAIEFRDNAGRDIRRTDRQGPERNRDTIRPNIPPTVDVVADLPSRGPTRYYAIVKGRNLGILLSWKAVLTSVSGYPHTKYKSFRRRAPAEEWYLQQMQIQGAISPEQDLSVDDISVDETVDYNASGLPTRPNDMRSGTPATDPIRPSEVYPHSSRRASNTDLVDFRMAGPDPSTGDSKKIHNVSINISSEVRDLLCPKGLTLEMQSRMLEVTPDILTCQGKSSAVQPGSEYELRARDNVE
jgi:hypothetical protein